QPICMLAQHLPVVELVVFLDEVNTSSCLSSIKEMLVDRNINGLPFPENIFFTAAINPHTKPNENEKDDISVHRRDYLVHELPEALEHLKCRYGSLPDSQLRDYIKRKIEMLDINDDTQKMPLDDYVQSVLCDSILSAQQFCMIHLGAYALDTTVGENSVSQREIQRCFSIIDFFWKLRYDDELNDRRENNDDDNDNAPNPVACIALSIALIYYFRLPTVADRVQYGDLKSATREQFSKVLSRTIPNFDCIIQTELERFVTHENFLIPNGVALNQAVENRI
ncbi:unnamed protein product, partial [Didymodactylos carnosus]